MLGFISPPNISKNLRSLRDCNPEEKRQQSEGRAWTIVGRASASEGPRDRYNGCRIRSYLAQHIYLTETLPDARRRDDPSSARSGCRGHVGSVLLAQAARQPWSAPTQCRAVGLTGMTPLGALDAITRTLCRCTVQGAGIAGRGAWLPRSSTWGFAKSW